MSLSNTEELSPSLQEQLGKAIETSEGTISLTMPVSELVSSTHHVNIQSNRAVMSVPLSYVDRIHLELTGTVNMLRDGTHGGSLSEIIQEQYRIRNIVILISCVLLGILFIIILIVIISKRKTNQT